MTKKAQVAVVVASVIIVVCAASLRLAYISSDPPHGLSQSRGDYTDEGLKYYEARNFALFGHWRIVSRAAMQGTLKPSPLPNLIGAAVFKAFGPGRVQARMISVVAGVMTCMLLILIGVRAGEPSVGLLAGAFAAVNFVLVSYDRLALFESPMTVLCLAAAFVYLCGGKLRIIATPILLVAAYFTRAHAAVIAAALAVVLAAEIWRRHPWRRSRDAFAFWGIAVAAVAVVALLLALFPGNQIVAHVKGRIVSTIGAGRYPPLAVALDLAVRAFSDSILPSWMPVTLIAALLGLSGALVRPWKGKTPPPAFLFFWWFVAEVALVSFLEYRPTRYYVLMLPAACYLAADWVVSLGTAVASPRGAGRGALWAVVRAFSGVHIAAAALAFAIARRFELPMLMNIDSEGIRRFQEFIEARFIGTRSVLAALEHADETVHLMWAHVGNLCALGLAILAVSLVWRALRKGRIARAAARVGPIIATLVVLAVIVSQATQAFTFFNPQNRRYEIEAAERGIRAAVGDNPRACIGGNWAPELCMGTPYFAFPLARGNGNSWDTFNRFPVTHLLLEESPDEAGYLFSAYSKPMARARLVKTFYIDLYRIDLFEYPSGGAAPPWPFDEGSQP